MLFLCHCNFWSYFLGSWISQHRIVAGSDQHHIGLLIFCSAKWKYAHILWQDKLITCAHFGFAWRVAKFFEKGCIICKRNYFWLELKHNEWSLKWIRMVQKLTIQNFKQDNMHYVPVTFEFLMLWRIWNM